MERNQVIYLDTHVLVRLYLGDVGFFGATARKALEENALVASPAAVLELEFLHQIGRLKPTAARLISSLSSELGLTVCSLPFRVVVEHAMRENWGRDPFDRLIVGNAKAAGAHLVSKDEKILKHYSKTLW